MTATISKPAPQAVATSEAAANVTASVTAGVETAVAAGIDAVVYAPMPTTVLANLPELQQRRFSFAEFEQMSDLGLAGAASDLGPQVPC
jgi:hypothetical protein